MMNTDLYMFLLYVFLVRKKDLHEEFNFFEKVFFFAVRKIA